MKILTGNDLKSGAVVWWTGNGWSIHVDEAIDAVSDDGKVRPAHIKDRIRALGPTVRPDLTLKPADPAAGTWVI